MSGLARLLVGVRPRGGAGGGTDPGPPPEDFNLASGGDLIAAMQAAPSGSTIVLEAGGTYDVTPGPHSFAKDITVRTQNSAGAFAIIRSGNGTGNYVHIQDPNGRYKFLMREGVDINTSRGVDPGDVNYIGPHLNANGSIDMTRCNSAKFEGETDYHDFPAGANPNDYVVLRGDGGDGFRVTSGTLKFSDVQIYGFRDPFDASGGTLFLERCVVIGCRTMFDISGSCTLKIYDCFMTGGTMNEWSWSDVKSLELDPEGKRTWISPRNHSGTIDVRRSTVHDFYDGIVGNPSQSVITIDQLTLDGRTDDLEQLNADQRQDFTITRSKIRGSSLGGNSSTTGSNSVTKLMQRCVVINARECHSYGFMRWRVLFPKHNSPIDPCEVRDCTLIERGGQNGNGVYIAYELGATWGGNATRPQVWDNVAIALAEDVRLGRDYDVASAGGLSISDTSILKLFSADARFFDGGDFTTWKSNSGDSTAQLVTNTGYTADDIWADPRLVSQLIGSDVGAIDAGALQEFDDIGDPNAWGTGRASLLSGLVL